MKLISKECAIKLNKDCCRTWSIICLINIILLFSRWKISVSIGKDEKLYKLFILNKCYLEHSMKVVNHQNKWNYHQLSIFKAAMNIGIIIYEWCSPIWYIFRRKENVCAQKSFLVTERKTRFMGMYKKQSMHQSLLTSEWKWKDKSFKTRVALEAKHKVETNILWIFSFRLHGSFLFSIYS